jgi:alanine racemase
MNSSIYRAWAEIDLDNLIHNLKEIRRLTENRTLVMAVVKADAYGHGAVEAAHALAGNGADRLAVSTLDEAVKLRKNGIIVPIQLLSHTCPSRAGEIVDLDIIQTVFDAELAEAISNEAIKRNKRAKVHVKIDTGMGRIGFQAGEQAVEGIKRISRLKGLEIEGMMTHFASSDDADESYTKCQLEKFLDTYDRLVKCGIDIPIRHAANSAGIIVHPQSHLEMVRPGIMLYGMYPSRDTCVPRADLKPVMSLKAKVISSSMFSKDLCISYGRTYKTNRDSRLIVLPVGYADGYCRLLSNQGRILVRGKYAPVVGRVCMDHFMADVTDFDEIVEAGEEAVLFGRQGDKEISVDELAGICRTISYEILCKIGLRIPRVYIRAGKVAGELNYLL